MRKPLVWLLCLGLVGFAGSPMLYGLEGPSVTEVNASYKELSPFCKEETKDGIEKKYNANGKLIAEFTCKNGKLHGLFKFYYENGNLREERTYKNGKYHGIDKTYYENGTLRSESEYSDGKTINYSRFYYPSGELKREGKFTGSGGKGIYEFYFKDGRLKDRCPFENGSFVGGCLGDSGLGVPRGFREYDITGHNK